MDNTDTKHRKNLIVLNLAQDFNAIRLIGENVRCDERKFERIGRYQRFCAASVWLIARVVRHHKPYGKLLDFKHQYFRLLIHVAMSDKALFRTPKFLPDSICRKFYFPSIYRRKTSHRKTKTLDCKQKWFKSKLKSRGHSTSLINPLCSHNIASNGEVKLSCA